jgi:hypothetical protein
VIIDDEWLVETTGERRLNNPADWLRREIELALEYQIPIIPLLIGQAMPIPEDLPDSLRELTEFQGMRLRAATFEVDLDKIIMEIETRAELRIAGQKIIASIREDWNQGNWRKIYKRLLEATASWGFEHGGRLLPRDIARRLAVAQQLMQVAEPIERRQFDTAMQVLSRIPLEDAPPNLKYSINFLEIGNRAIRAIENSDLRALKAAAEAYDVAKREAHGLAFEFIPGLEQVGKIISDAQAELSHRQSETPPTQRVVASVTPAPQEIAGFVDSKAKIETKPRTKRRERRHVAANKNKVGAERRGSQQSRKKEWKEETKSALRNYQKAAKVDVKAKLKREAAKNVLDDRSISITRSSRKNQTLPNIFISYRRQDTKWQARMIFEAFQRELSDENVFMNIDSIPLGVDFVKVLRHWVGKCEILIALIGEGWLNARDPKTRKRRLENPNDFVRVEIREALKRDIPVVPVLLDSAAMPPQKDLPKDLKGLARRQAEFLEFRTFSTDLQRLLHKLGVSARQRDATRRSSRKPR